MSFCVCKDINIYYEIVGEGPPLLLINGLAADTRRWLPLAGFLKTSFQLVMYDMRGAGRTDKPDEPSTIGQITEETYNFIRLLGYDRLHVLGFSMGGCVAIDLAIRHPEVINKLVMVSTLPSWHRPHPPSGELNQLFHRLDVSQALLREVFNKIFGPEYKKRVPAETYIKMRMEDENPQPVYAYLNQLRALENFDCAEDIQKISAPTLIVTGDSDEVVPPLNSKWMHERIAGSQMVIFKGVGHIVPDEAPYELSEKMILFLADFQ